MKLVVLFGILAALFFVLGYLLQAGLINPFITRPEHSQFMLLVAVAIILVNGLLMGFGRVAPDDIDTAVGRIGEILDAAG